MTRVLLGSVVLLAALGFTLTAQDKGKPKDEKPVDPLHRTLAEQIKAYSQNHGRGCGARLTISDAKMVLIDEKYWVVRVNWEIDYNGPRPPLTIAKPSMGLALGERTCLGFHYEPDKGGRAGLTYMCNERPHHLTMPAKDDFVTIEKGKTAVSGVLDVSTVTQPGVRPERTIPFRDWKEPFYVQLWHNPKERGNEFGFDAWTGQMVSNIIEVKDK